MYRATLIKNMPAQNAASDQASQVVARALTSLTPCPRCLVSSVTPVLYSASVSQALRSRAMGESMRQDSRCSVLRSRTGGDASVRSMTPGPASASDPALTVKRSVFRGQQLLYLADTLMTIIASVS